MARLFSTCSPFSFLGLDIAGHVLGTRVSIWKTSCVNRWMAGSACLGVRYMYTYIYRCIMVWCMAVIGQICIAGHFRHAPADHCPKLLIKIEKPLPPSFDFSSRHDWTDGEDAQDNGAKMRMSDLVSVALEGPGCLLFCPVVHSPR
jgi:hypothetical protein